MKRMILKTCQIGLIIIALLIANSFVGNPVSNALAKKAAQQYIDTTYDELNLQIQTCSYNFKFSHYSAYVQSTTSQDTAFRIRVDSLGNVQGDDYESEVADHFTTYRRLDQELQEMIHKSIDGKLPYDIESIFLSFVEGADFTKLSKDMELDIHNPPFPLIVDVTLFSDDISYSKIAEVAKSLEHIHEEQNIPIDEYSVRLLPLSNKPENENQAVAWSNSLSVFEFPAERLSEENLPQVMEQFGATL